MVKEIPCPRPTPRISNGYKILSWTSDGQEPPVLNTESIIKIRYYMSRGRHVYIIPADKPNIIIENNSPTFLIETILKTSVISEIGVDGLDDLVDEILEGLYKLLGPKNKMNLSQNPQDNPIKNTTYQRYTKQ